METNTPVLWDEIWKNPAAKEQDVLALLKEENGIRWQRMEKVVLREYGSFEGLKAIEIGAGVGTNSALMTKRGAKVTVLDYSEGALKRAQNSLNTTSLTPIL